MIKAVIFDMDGVISDTLPLHTAAETRVFANYGIHVTSDQLLSEFNAVPDPVMYNALFARFKKKKPDLDKLADEKFAIFSELARDNIHAVPGVIDFIKQLKQQGYILGVASSSPTEIVDVVLETLSIRDSFSAITPTAEVERGKPHPDIFLRTARKLGVSPETCLVVEDAPNGVEAAKRAGMSCIAITTSVTKDKLQEANLVIDSFNELTIDTIKKL